MKKILVVGLLFASLALMVFPGRSLAALDDAGMAALRAQIAALLVQIQQLQQQVAAMQGGVGSSDVVSPGSNPYTIPGSGGYQSGTKLALGLSVGTRVMAKEAVRIRSVANGAAVVTAQAGAKGTVAGNSVWKDGYWWAEIYWDNRVRGFSAEDYLEITKQNITGICGDLNGDGVVNIQDTTWIKLYATGGAPIPMGTNADMNGDGAVNVLDQMSLESYVLRGGAQPSCVPPQSFPVQPTGANPIFNSIANTNVFVPDYSMCGDVNGDRGLSIFDVDLLSEVAFQGRVLPVGARADLNADGVVDILDVTLITNHVNKGAVAPTCMKPNNAPTIIGLPALPARIEAGQNVNLSWTATDANNNPLQWNVTWGDGAVSACSVNCPNQYSVAHTWNFPGTYKVEAKVFDGMAWSQPHSFTLEILAKTIVPTTAVPVLTCGDIDLNGLVNDADSVLMTDYVFGGLPIPNMAVVDLNGDGVPNIIDVTLLTNILRNRTPLPTCPLLNTNPYSPYSGTAGT